jgi:hypothetical protein
MKHFMLSALIAGAIAAISFVSPASAQASRTWVSGTGDDVNPCSRTAPCKTFAGAISKTAASGEINCLDSAGYGAITITKSMTLKCQGVVGSVLVSGVNGIVVSGTAATDHVVIEGLEVEGIGTGLNGIQIVGGGFVEVLSTSIRHFTQNGVNVVGTAGLRVNVDSSTIVNNAGGVNVQGAAGAANSALVTRSVLDQNSSFGLQVNGAANSAFIFQDIIAASTGASLQALNGGTITSFGPSSLISSGSPNSTIPLK